jgi:predicted metalloprotease with PDZ domain
MKARAAGLVGCGPALLLSASAIWAQQSFIYQLEYAASGNERVVVRLIPPSLPPGPQTLVMPRAIPMGYGEQPYDRFLTGVRAFNRGSELPVERQGDAPRWRVGGPDAEIRRIEYEVDVARMEREIFSAADSSKVRPGYLALLGYSVFAFLEGFEEAPVVLDVSAPKDWPVLLTLAPAFPAPASRSSARAPNFYALADSQVIAGPQFLLQRREGSVPLFIATYAEGEVDADAVAELAHQAFERVIAYFGGGAFPHYTVHQEFLRPVSERHRYGFSMEHLLSGTFYLAVDTGITARSSEMERARTRYNFAHHMAHAWIPKRSYGKGYYPFTWELAPVLDSIWFSEGFAQYAAIQALAAGLGAAEAEAYRQRMLEVRFRQTLAEAPAFIRKMSLVELSRVASTRYSEDFRTGRNVFSRGGLMAAEMDDHIRQKSGGEKSLRDALRHLVAWSERSRRPFRIEELPVLFSMGTGVDTREILNRWLKPLEE